MHHLSGGPSPTASAKQGLRIKNLAYSAFVACALAASLPNQATIVAEHPNLVNWGQLASTASIVVSADATTAYPSSSSSQITGRSSPGGQTRAKQVVPLFPAGLPLRPVPAARVCNPAL